MDVYVVIGGYDYEGYSEPSAVFSTEEKAKEYVKTVGVLGDSVDILRYELDEQSSGSK